MTGGGGRRAGGGRRPRPWHPVGWKNKATLPWGLLRERAEPQEREREKLQAEFGNNTDWGWQMMIAYQAYRAQTALKEDQASKFRDLITSDPNQAVPRQAADLAEWLQDNHQTLGHLALEELHGIAKELAFTCRK